MVRRIHSPSELAKYLDVSPRHLTRLFRDELSTTPARHVETIRFDLAKALLDQGHTATRTASLADRRPVTHTTQLGCIARRVPVPL
ncbi:helix-turn-helix domain-containing protein [Streptomyces sp. B93]|uniref:helix-turn-helix domain-containing protein n=1 Tax=Streptomyces sp. B93 TaxID=2824875 RepID=UPI0035A990D2